MYNTLGIVPGTVQVLTPGTATTTCTWNSTTKRFDCTGPAQPGEVIAVGEDLPATPTRSAAWTQSLPQPPVIRPATTPPVPVWLLGLAGVVGLSTIVLVTVLLRR
jgi:hypothetical protein